MRLCDRRRSRAGLAIGLLLVLSTPLAAQAEELLFGGNDWYMTTLGVLAADVSKTSGAKPGGGAGLGAGFRFNRWLSAEIGGEWIDQIRYDRGEGPLSCRGTGGQSNGFSTWQVSGGGRVYLTQAQIQPFVVAHGGFMQTRDHGGGRSCQGNGFVARMGAGVDVFVTNGLAVSLVGTYVLPATSQINDHDYVSVGLGLTWY